MPDEDVDDATGDDATGDDATARRADGSSGGSGRTIERAAAVDRVVALRSELLADGATTEVQLDAIDGRALSADLTAPSDVPARDRATMDGFAFRSGDGSPLAIVGSETYPEDDPPEIDEGEAVRVATGAPLPGRANVVVKREDATVEDGRLRSPDLAPGTHVHDRGSDVSAGETLFEAGEVLSPKDAVLLTDLGVDAVTVHGRFSVGVLATGTEIHEGRSPDRDSAMLAGLVESWGHRATFEGSVPDEYERVSGAIDAAAADHDVVITSGGTSVGTKDHVVRALDDLGAVEFRGVRVRPGRPVTVARLAERDAVAVAVPGKPLAAHTAAVLVARPLFTGESAFPAVEARMARDLGVPRDEVEYAIPVILADDEAMPMGHADSPLAAYGDTFDPSVLASSPRATRADGLVLAGDDLSAGDSVRVVPYSSLE